MKQSTIYMLVLWGLVFLSTPFDYLLEDKSFYNAYVFTSSIILLFIIFAWFISDARELGVKPSNGLKIGVILLAVIFVPYYLVKHKGWHRSFKSFVKFLAFLIPLILYELLFEYYYYNA